MIEQIVYSITIIIDETGIINYEQISQHNILLNTLKTKLTSLLSDVSTYLPTKDDIISLDRNEDNMNILQPEESFTNTINNGFNISLNNHLS